MTRLLERAGFVDIGTWIESLEHRWRPQDHFEYQVRGTSRLRLESEQYVFRGEVVMATAARPDASR